MTVLESALRYAQGGLSVIPIRADGTKAADTKWEPYQKRRATEEEIRQWFGGERPVGVAIVCGSVSGNLLVIDFDQPGFFDEWAEGIRTADQDVLGTLPIVRTPTGYGRHVFMRTTAAVPGAKLAKAPAGNGKAPWVVAIETRGEGQYVLAPGSPGACHPSGATYEHLSGPFPEDAPILAAEAVDLLLSSARALNRYVEARAIVGEMQRAEEKINRPGDDYCRRGDWEALLTKHGWEKVREKPGESFWRRPGKEDRGISATLGHCRTEHSGALFYVFSSNAAPLESDRAYNLFGALCLLEFSGDFHAAAVRLAADGYGNPPPEEILAQVNEAIGRIKQRIAVMGEEAPLLAAPRIEAPLKSDPKFKRTWNRSRQELNLDQSRYDASLLWYARRLNFSIEDMIAIVYDHRVRHQAAPRQALDAIYMAKKIVWVLGSGDSEEATLAATEAQQVINGGEDNVVREIRARTGIKDFVRVIQRGIEEEMYCIELEGEKIVEVGGVKVFREQQRQFIGQIYKLLGVNMEELKGYEWKALHDLFLQRRVVETNEEEDPEVAGNWVVERYLMVNQLHVVETEEGRLDALRASEPFVQSGVLWLHFGHFWDWVMTVRPRERGWGSKKMRSLVRGLGFRDHKIAGPYPRVYHCRAVDDFPSRQIAEKILQSRNSSTKRGGESTYE